MESVKEVLMRRDNMSSEEADQLIGEFEVELENLENIDDAYDLIQEYFGLEPDYLEEFLS